MRVHRAALQHSSGCVKCKLAFAQHGIVLRYGRIDSIIDKNGRVDIYGEKIHVLIVERKAFHSPPPKLGH